MTPNESISQRSIFRVCGDLSLETDDILAVEEPLEIRLDAVVNGKREHRAVSITMRTPGNDEELAVGFLVTESIIKSRSDVEYARPCGLSINGSSHTNTVRVRVADCVEIDWKRLERHFYTSSSCGVCGKSSLESVYNLQSISPFPMDFTVTSKLICSLPAQLNKTQEIFQRTGGLHASALFTFSGEFIQLMEDVGRHNALDKLIGSQLLADQLPLNNKILLLSGRASFELIQKAASASISIVAAVGAPSTLAVELAERCGITLIGFLKENRFNIYSGAERIETSSGDRETVLCHK